MLTTIVTGIDFVQEKFMGAGPQNNESAVEQAKDEQISDFSESKILKWLTDSANVDCSSRTIQEHYWK